jgi:hypothetical protein
VVPAVGGDGERERLEQLIAAQRQVISQLEQTEAALGALTPGPIKQALTEARDTLSKAEADLQALTAGAPAPAPVAVAPAA